MDFAEETISKNRDLRQVDIKIVYELKDGSFLES
jgi:hypothetical protein